MLHRRVGGACTLVELLVVIAIIGILISLLIPTLSSAREEAYATICTTQLDQIFDASFMYTTKNNDQMPYFGRLATRPDPAHWWITQIAEDIQHQLKILACPTDDQPLRVASVTRTVQFDFGDASNNYHGFGYQKSLWEYARWKKEPAARTNGPLTIAGPSATGAWFVDMSYRGSCDTVEEVQVPIGASYVNNPRTRTVQQARRITDWSKPAKVIMLVEGEAPRTPHARCSTLASASANFIPGECFRYSEDLAPLLKSLQTRLQNAYTDRAGHATTATPITYSWTVTWSVCFPRMPGKSPTTGRSISPTIDRKRPGLPSFRPYGRRI